MSSVTPFKAQQSVASHYNLNATADNIRLSKKSLRSGSLAGANKTICNESMVSIGGEHKRSTSLTIADVRKRQLNSIKTGYRSNLIFEHTIADIIKVLEHKLGKTGVNKANDQTQMDYHNFKSLDSDSDGEDQTKRSPSNGSVSGIDIGSVLGGLAQQATAAKPNAMPGGMSVEMVQKLLGSI